MLTNRDINDATLRSIYRTSESIKNIEKILDRDLPRIARALEKLAGIEEEHTISEEN